MNTSINLVANVCNYKRSSLVDPFNYRGKTTKFKRSTVLLPCRCFLERIYEGENPDFDQNHNIAISNPLLRLEQLGTRWFGLIIDLDSLLVEGSNIDSQDAWMKLAQKKKLRYPSKYDLKVAERSSPTQFITQIMLWGTDRYFVRDLIKEYRRLLQKNSTPKSCIDLKPGVHNFLRMMTSQDIPCIITSSESRQDLRATLISLGIHTYFDVEDEDKLPNSHNKIVEKIAGCDDTANGLPDPELYAYAANLIQRACDRCVVLGASISCCEAAHSLGMKCVLIQGGKTRRWELTGADIVKSSLEEVFFQDFKELFSSDLD
jgi:beta-phosphoglucomutase-like phosphatase (HAD superfamily)